MFCGCSSQDDVNDVNNADNNSSNSVLKEEHINLINETFTTSPASNFTVVSGGTWAVTGGKYVLTSPASGGVGLNGNISTHNTSLTGDWTLTVDASVTATTSSWDDFSVIFGYQNSTNYYYLSFNESNNDNTSGIMKVTAGVPSQLADITSLITGGTTYAVEITKVGNTYSVYRNTVLMASATDATWSSGKVGFGTKNDGASYDNLLVTSAAGDTVTYQAESFTAQSGCVVATNNAGYTGSGFVDMGSDGTWFELNNIVGAGDTATLAIRYANGGPTNRQCAVTVNGANIGNISFAPTGGWTTWVVTNVNATLNTGNNTVRLTANTTPGPNVDKIDVTGGGSGGGDTQAPSAPSGLASSNITSSSFTLTWTASTDNVGVASYEVFRNGTSVGTSTTTSKSVTGLTASTTYSMTVKAKDAAGNVSAASSALNVTTTSGTTTYDYRADFDTYDEGNAELIGGSLTIVANPHVDAINGASNVMRCRVSNGGKRAEYSSPRLITNETKRVYRWMYYIPTNLPVSDLGWIVLSQWKTWPCSACSTTHDDVICGGCSGIFDEVRGENGEFEVNWRAEPDCNTWTSTLVKGEWVSFVMDIYWTNSSNGYAKLWMNGTLVKNLSNIKTLFDSFPSDGSCNIYWAIGLYGPLTGTPAYADVFIDNISIEEY